MMVDEQLTKELKYRFHVTQAPKPKRRLNAIDKDILFKQQAWIDPSETYHDLYVCHEKCPRGSST
jgi:hypothetical protein